MRSTRQPLDQPNTARRLPAWLRRLFDRPYLLLTLAVFFWAGNFVLGRAVRLEVPPVGLAFWRWAGGSLLVFGFAWPHLKRDWAVVVRHWKIVLLLSFLGVALFNTLVYTGLQYTTAINALLMQSTMPVQIVAVSFLLFRETITARQAAGVALSLAGVATIIARGDPQVLLHFTPNAGDLLILVAVLGYAAYSALLRRRPPLHPLSFLAVTFIAGTIMLLPFYLAENLAGRVMALNAVTLLAVAYVAVFPSILSYLCYNRGVELAGANRAGPFFHLMPVFGSIMAIGLLGERFAWFHFVGIGLILAGIILATR